MKAQNVIFSFLGLVRSDKMKMKMKTRAFVFIFIAGKERPNKSYNVFFNKIKTRNIQNLNPIRLLISSPGGFMDFGVFFNGAAATFD